TLRDKSSPDSWISRNVWVAAAGLALQSVLPFKSLAERLLSTRYTRLPAWPATFSSGITTPFSKLTLSSDRSILPVMAMAVLLKGSHTVPASEGAPGIAIRAAAIKNFFINGPTEIWTNRCAAPWGHFRWEPAPGHRR